MQGILVILRSKYMQQTEVCLQVYQALFANFKTRIMDK